MWYAAPTKTLLFASNLLRLLQREVILRCGKCSIECLQFLWYTAILHWKSLRVTNTVCFYTSSLLAFESCIRHLALHFFVLGLDLFCWDHSVIISAQSLWSAFRAPNAILFNARCIAVEVYNNYNKLLHTPSLVSVCLA